MSFTDALAQELQGVPWIGGPAGGAYMGEVGADHDASITLLKECGKALHAPDADVSWLPALAHDRLVLRAPVETAEDFAARLARSIEIWENGGQSTGYVQVFEPYGFTSATCQFLSNHEVGGSWDGNQEWFSRVFGFLDSTAGYWSTDGLWSDVPDDHWSDAEDPTALTWDSSATVGDLHYIRSAVRLQKADYAYPVTVAVWLQGDGALPDGYWDSPGLLDDGGNWDEGDGLEQPLYWTLGTVYGQEDWTGDGSDFYPAEDANTDSLTGDDAWIDFL